MAYLTEDALRVAVGGAAKLVQLTDDNNDNTADADVIAQLISEVDGYINGYVGKRYAVPLGTVPSTVSALAAREGARRARRRRGGAISIGDDIELEKLDREWLEAIASGMVTLGVEPAPAKSELVVDEVGDRDTLRTTTRNNTKGFW